MQSFKNVSLCITCAMLLSMTQTTETKFLSKKTGGTILVIMTVLSLPYMINFLKRKPLEKPRFDPSKLLNGDVKETLLQLHYFIADKLWGWPFKDSKLKIGKNAEGKPDLKVSKGQAPGGLIGNTLVYMHLLNKSIAIPVGMITLGISGKNGLETLYNLDF